MHHIPLLDEEKDLENSTTVKTARYKVKRLYLSLFPIIL
jgi:hypothetical protein